MRINETTTGCKTNQPTIEKKKTMSKTQKIYFVLVDNLFYHTSCCCPRRRSSRPGIKKNAVFVVNTFLYLIRVCGRIEKKKMLAN